MKTVAVIGIWRYVLFVGIKVTIFLLG